MLAGSAECVMEASLSGSEVFLSMWKKLISLNFLTIVRMFYLQNREKAREDFSHKWCVSNGHFVSHHLSPIFSVDLHYVTGIMARVETCIGAFDSGCSVVVASNVCLGWFTPHRGTVRWFLLATHHRLWLLAHLKRRDERDGTPQPWPLPISHGYMLHFRFHMVGGIVCFMIVVLCMDVVLLVVHIVCFHGVVRIVALGAAAWALPVRTVHAARWRRAAHVPFAVVVTPRCRTVYQFAAPVRGCGWPAPVRGCGRLALVAEAGRVPSWVAYPVICLRGWASYVLVLVQVDLVVGVDWWWWWRWLSLTVISLTLIP